MLEALAHDETKKRFAELGLEDAAARAADARRHCARSRRSEADKWWPIIKAANIKGQ